MAKSTTTRSDPEKTGEQDAETRAAASETERESSRQGTREGDQGDVKSAADRGGQSIDVRPGATVSIHVTDPASGPAPKEDPNARSSFDQPSQAESDQVLLEGGLRSGAQRGGQPAPQTIGIRRGQPEAGKTEERDARSERLIRGLLEQVGARMGDQSRSAIMCESCTGIGIHNLETKQHRCACICHEAREYLAELDQERSGETKPAGEEAKPEGDDAALRDASGKKLGEESGEGATL